MPRKTIKGLPPEFEIARYDGAAEFTLLDWAKALSFRRALSGPYREILSGPEIPPTEKFMLKVLSDPLATDRFLLEPDVLAMSSRFRSPIERLSILGLHALNRFIRHDSEYAKVAPKIEAYFEQLWRTDGKVSRPGVDEQKWLYAPVDSTGTAGGLVGDQLLLTVNLDCGDDQLFSDFKAMISEARASRGVEAGAGNFSHADVRKWHSYRLLAFIDLSLWAAVTESKIPHRLMGAALYPPGADFDPTERVRKTLPGAAESLLAPSSLATLWAQARAENGKNFPKNIPENIPESK